MSTDCSYFVYGLFDPRTGVIFYVGLTENTTLRLSSHISSSRNGACEKSRIIREIVGLSMSPELRVLASFRHRYLACAAERMFQVVMAGQIVNGKERGDWAHSDPVPVPILMAAVDVLMQELRHQATIWWRLSMYSRSISKRERLHAKENAASIRNNVDSLRVELGIGRRSIE